MVQDAGSWGGLKLLGPSSFPCCHLPGLPRLPSGDRRGSAVLSTKPRPWVPTGRQDISWAPGSGPGPTRQPQGSWILLFLFGSGGLARLHGWYR